MKTKLMIGTDWMASGTGFSEEMRNIAYRLVQSGEYEIYWLGFNYVGLPLDYPDSIFSDLPHTGATIKGLCGYGPSQLFGLNGFKNNFHKYNPDFFLSMGDPRTFQPYARWRYETKTKFPYVAYTTLDGIPVHPSWKPTFSQINIPLAMTEWALDQYQKAEIPMAGYIHHGVNWEWMARSRESKRKAREIFGINEDTVLFMDWNTNQYRKRTDALLECWKAFKPESKNAKLFLYMDSDMSEPHKQLGWHLEDLMKQMDIPRDTVLLPEDVFKRRKYFESAEDMDFHKMVISMADILISCTCFTPDTNIYCDFGVKTILDIKRNNKLISDNIIGTVKELHESYYKGKMLKIKPTGRLRFKTSPIHKIKVLSRISRKNKPYKRYSYDFKNRIKSGDYNIVEKYASELIVGDYLLIPRIKGIYELDYSDDLIEIIGYFVAEGCVSRRHDRRSDAIIFSVNSNEIDFTNRILELMKKLYNLDGRIVDDTRNRRRITFYSVDVAEWFEQFGHGAFNKTLLNDMLYLPDGQIKLLINSLWRGDGSDSFSVAKNINIYEYSTISKQLAFQMEILLNKIGAPCGVKYNNKKAAYTITLSGFGIEVVTGNKTRIKYKERMIVTDDYIFTPIYSIDKIDYDGMVYDIEMDGLPYYSVSVVVHNSGEGFGKVFLEALSLGIPIICPYYSSLPEVCEKGALLIPLYDGPAGHYRVQDAIRSVYGGIVNQEKFVEAMTRLYDHPDEREELGAQGREWAKNFDYDTQIVPGWMNILGSVNPDVIYAQELLGGVM